MIYGQSMGSEISAELGKQLLSRKIKVENIFFDGAPMIRLSRVYKLFMYFFYGTEEKAYKTCIKKVIKEYPKANYILKEGHGHMTYSVENFDEYIKLLRNICNGYINVLE